MNARERPCLALSGVVPQARPMDAHHPSRSHARISQLGHGSQHTEGGVRMATAARSREPEGDRTSALPGSSTVFSALRRCRAMASMLVLFDRAVWGLSHWLYVMALLR